MRESNVVAGAIDLVRDWLRDDLGCAAVAARRECRTVDGTGRADALVYGRLPDGALEVVALEAKGRSGLAQLLPWGELWDESSEEEDLADDGDDGVSGPVWTHAAVTLQLARYPANLRVLAMPDRGLDDVPGAEAILRALCRRDGLGLVAIDWYRQGRWLERPVHLPTPALWQDVLEAYAAGDALRGRL